MDLERGWPSLRLPGDCRDRRGETGSHPHAEERRRPFPGVWRPVVANRLSRTKRNEYSHPSSIRPAVDSGRRPWNDVAPGEPPERLLDHGESVANYRTHHAFQL